jgi:hypothetical protein
LEEIIPENLLSEPPKTDNPIICSEVPDDGLLPCDPVRQEVTRIISRASSTLEGSLAHEDAPAPNAADPSHLGPLDMAEGPLALDVATTKGPAPKGGAGSDPALEGVGQVPLLLPPWTSTLDRC